MDLDLSTWLPNFPVREQCLYLDHAALAPLARPVVEAMQRRIEDQMKSGSANSQDWEQNHLSCRHLAAQIVGCEAEDISLIPNTSHGLSLIASGLNWNEGDEILIGEEEFAANVAPWLNLTNRGVRIIRVPQPDGRLEDIGAYITDRTRLFAISWVSFHTGWMSDLENLGAQCRKRGVFTVVDAIQGLGVVPICMRRLPIDAVVAGGYKWLLGPQGVGIMATTPRFRNALQTGIAGWRNVRRGPGDLFLDRLEFVEDGQRFEPGAANDIGHAGFAAALDIITTIEVSNIHIRIEMLSRLITRILIAHGWQVISPGSAHPIAGIVAGRHPTVQPRECVRRLQERHVIVSLRQGYVRFSPHFYTTRGELEALDQILEKCGM